MAKAKVASNFGMAKKRPNDNELQELAEDKILVEEGRGKYKINPKNINDDLLPKNYLIGTIDMKQTGKAYVIPQEEGREDVMIAPNNTHHALHGDTVKVLMFPQRKMHKPEGQVVEVLKRARTRFVGIIQKQDRFAFLVSDSRSMVVDILIPLNDLAGAEDGEKVLVEMTDWPERMNNPVGRVVKRLGRPGDNNVEMQSILAEYDFPLDFPAEAEKEAEDIEAPSKKDLEGRRDYRKVLTFTIDPADAKDFDDALSFRRAQRTATPRWASISPTCRTMSNPAAPSTAKPTSAAPASIWSTAPSPCCPRSSATVSARCAPTRTSSASAW